MLRRNVNVNANVHSCLYNEGVFFSKKKVEIDLRQGYVKGSIENGRRHNFKEGMLKVCLSKKRYKNHMECVWYIMSYY